MKLNRYVLFMMLSVSLLVFTGCGDKTIYENVTSVSTGTTPDAFTFTSQTDVALGSTVTSDLITVSGITEAAQISVSEGSYSIGSENFTSSVGTVTNGQGVRVRHTASASNNASRVTVLTIGGVSATFTSTTVAADTGVALTGEEQFAKSCGGCHSARGLAKTTLAQIKSAAMTMGVDDVQLQKIVDYLATK